MLSSPSQSSTNIDELTEVELLTQQLLNAGRKNKDLQEQFLQYKVSSQGAKALSKNFRFTFKNKKKKISYFQHLDYASKKSQEHKWEIEKQLEAEQSQSKQQQQELIKLQNSLEEVKQQGEQQERVILFLRERVEEFSLEAKQLKQDYQGALEINRQLREQLSSSEISSTGIHTQVETLTQDKQELENEVKIFHSSLTI